MIFEMRRDPLFELNSEAVRRGLSKDQGKGKGEA